MLRGSSGFPQCFLGFPFFSAFFPVFSRFSPLFPRFLVGVFGRFSPQFFPGLRLAGHLAGGDTGSALRTFTEMHQAGLVASRAPRKDERDEGSGRLACGEMGHGLQNLCVKVVIILRRRFFYRRWVDEHPLATYSDAHQGCRVSNAAVTPTRSLS